MVVKIKKLTNEAVIPEYKHSGVDMGMDVTCTSYEYDSKYDRFIYHSGLAFEVPKNYGMLIFPRSSNTKTEAYLPNSVGILDSSYRGELLFIYKLRTALNVKNKLLTALEIENEFAPYKKGDKIGQIVILPYPQITFEEVSKLEDSERGSDGGLIRDDKNFRQ